MVKQIGRSSPDREVPWMYENVEYLWWRVCTIFTLLFHELQICKVLLVQLVWNVCTKIAFWKALWKSNSRKRTYYSIVCTAIVNFQSSFPKNSGEGALPTVQSRRPREEVPGVPGRIPQDSQWPPRKPRQLEEALLLPGGEGGRILRGYWQAARVGQSAQEAAEGLRKNISFSFRLTIEIRQKKLK